MILPINSIDLEIDAEPSFNLCCFQVTLVNINSREKCAGVTKLYNKMFKTCSTAKIIHVSAVNCDN